jgi:uncharacterized repeat protein (TIGR03806 family)
MAWPDDVVVIAMKIVARCFLLLLLVALPVLAQPFGLTSRQANTTLAMPQVPATYGYTLTNAYSGFSTPICATTPPGESNRLFVVERAGRIVIVTNLALTGGTRPTFLDIRTRVSTQVEEGMLGLAFHPGYATNGYFFVAYSYTNTAVANSGIYNRVSRFSVTAGDTNAADAASELILFSQLDDAPNHNGGDIHFGPDGYLYVTLGDEGNQNDSLLNSQRIDRDFFCGILRLDVDKRPENLAPNGHAALLGQTNYFVPADNPFVGVTQYNGTNLNPASVRTEFWAVGLRNPWRIAFDELTGTLYCGDVGGSAREEINVIVKGGNYGWVFREGTLAGPVANRQGPAGFVSRPPIFEYERGTGPTQGNSVTGGRIYRGSRIAQLYGRYVFCDYGSGNVWALTPDGTNTVATAERLLGQGNISSFAVDPRNGDILLVNLGGSLQRLIYNTTVTSGTPIPATLVDAGVFSSTTTLTPNAGIVPYELNVPFWSDNARKTRWFSVPDLSQTITFHRDENWLFPTGTVWIKHFDLELTNGSPASLKRLETRVLVKNSGGIYGVTYRWGTSTSNATLVSEEGMEESFAINDGGTTRTQVWRYPSRSQCLDCHTTVGGHALGFHTAQMNRNYNYSAATDNQLRALEHVGYFSNTVTNRHTLRALAVATDTAHSLEFRVRSYLDANCRQCHQPGGVIRSSWDARIQNPLSLAGIINGALQNDLGETANRVIVPNDTAHSVLLSRISQNGVLRMPPVGSSVIDTNAVNLVTAWIASLAGYQTFAQWQVAQFGSTTAPLTGPEEDYDGDGLANFAEYLLGTSPQNPASTWNLQLTVDGGGASIQFPQIANRGFEVQYTTNLLPPRVWLPLDTPGNRPQFSGTGSQATVTDTESGTFRFYRVRILEP